MGNKALFLINSFVSVQAACIGTLRYQFTMDELQGATIYDAGVQRVNLSIPSNYSFSTYQNPQGVSSLVLDAGAMMSALTNFQRPAQSTVTTWFQTLGATELALYSWSNPSFYVYVRILNGQVGVVINTNIYATSAVLTVNKYNNGEWHFLTVTYDDRAQSATLTVDCHLGGESFTVLTGSPQSHNTFQIGGLNTPAWKLMFAGQLDDLRVYGSVLSMYDMIMIATQVDSPCFPDGALAMNSPVISTAPASYPLHFALDPTNVLICGGLDPKNCKNNRYGVALTACAGRVAAVALTLAFNNASSGTTKSVETSLLSCATAYMFNYTAAPVNTPSLCSDALRTAVAAIPFNPIGSASVNSITFTSGSVPLIYKLSVVVGNAVLNSQVAPTVQPAVANVQCINGTDRALLSAAWQQPVLSNGSICTGCTYRVWYNPVSLVQSGQVNLGTMCGLNLYGQPLADIITTTAFTNFVLPSIVSVPGDTYIWVITANLEDNIEGVVSVLSSCPVRHHPVPTTPTSPTQPTAPSASVFPTPPTPAQVPVSNTNTLRLKGNIVQYPEGPLRIRFEQSFALNISSALHADVQRFVVASMTQVCSGCTEFIVTYIIGPPLPWSYDTRQAGDLSLELLRLFFNKYSVLYTAVPTVDSSILAFASSNSTVMSLLVSGTLTPPPTPAQTWQSSINKPSVYGWIIGAGVLVLVIITLVVIWCRKRKMYGPTRDQASDAKALHQAQRTQFDNAVTSSNSNEQFKNNSLELRTGGLDTSTTSPNVTKYAMHTFASPTPMSNNSYRYVTNPGIQMTHEIKRDFREGSAVERDFREASEVVAKYHYGEEDGALEGKDLFFRQGDIIKVLDHSCEDGPGWLMGECRGYQGCVPVEFVQPHKYY